MMIKYRIWLELQSESDLQIEESQRHARKASLVNRVFVAIQDTLFNVVLHNSFILYILHILFHVFLQSYRISSDRIHK